MMDGVGGCVVRRELKVWLDDGWVGLVIICRLIRVLYVPASFGCTEIALSVLFVMRGLVMIYFRLHLALQKFTFIFPFTFTFTWAKAHIRLVVVLVNRI